MKQIKLLVMDVDGTLTDGSLYMGDNGEVFKKFNVKDGYGIKKILHDKDIIPVIITGRKSRILENRCKELGITEISQGCDDKAEELKRLIKKYNITYSQVACIGDDLNDYEIMSVSGFAGCPSDAAEEIKNISHYITKAQGGCGAVREFIEWLSEKGE